MKKSQLETLIREVIRETIRKVDGKYVVYPEKGGKRLGTHPTKSAAEKQLTAIHLNKVAEVKQEATDSMAVIFDRNENDLFLYDTTAKQILGYINVYGNSVTGVAAKKGYGPLIYELGMAHVYPNALQSDRNGNTEPEAKAVWEKFIAGANPKIKVVKLSPSDKEYRTKYPNGYEIWDSDQFYNYKFYNPDTSTLRKLTSNGNSLSLEEKNEIIKLGNDFYHSLVSESSKVEENYVLQDLEDKFDIDLDLHDDGKALTLSRIVIPKDKRGQGIGSKVMNLITQYADAQNKPVYLTPSKDFGATSAGRLEQFYKQFGFKKKDRSDFSTKETMVREPQTLENYADGKVKGKSRPGRVKKAGASCKGSVTDLQKKVNTASGERRKMLQWCLNMKRGKKRASK